MDDPRHAATLRIVREATRIAHAAALEIAEKAEAEDAGDLARMIMLAGGVALVGMGIKDGGRFVLPSADRVALVNSGLAANKVRYRLVEVQ
jgi:hypothetical protein